MFFPKVVCKILACVCRWKERSNMMKCGFIPCCIFQNMFQHKEHFKLRSRLLTLVFKVTPPSGLPTLPLLSPVLLTSPLFQSTQAAHCAYNILIQQSSNKQTFVQSPPYAWNFTESYRRKEQKSLLLSLHSWKFSGKDKQVHE